MHILVERLLQTRPASQRRGQECAKWSNVGNWGPISSDDGVSNGVIFFVHPSLMAAMMLAMMIASIVSPLEATVKYFLKRTA